MVTSPARAGRPRFDIANIVRAHRAELEAEHKLSKAQCRVLSAIEVCRTAALGGHVDVCRSCGHEHPAYNSCRNRHCPKCQALAQEKWIAERAERILPVRHFHVVFTLPAQLRPLAKRFPEVLYDALLRAAADTLADLACDRLDGKLGITVVLHTWTRELTLHPHIHAIVTAGALTADGVAWKPTRSNYLFPVKVMGALLRGKMIAAIRRAHQKGRLDGFDALRTPEQLESFLDELSRRNWVVYAKKPFRRADHLLQYLGRYTHRVGISNSRLVDVRADAVTFTTKHGKTTSLAPVTFLQRFVQHVLPAKLKKIRHYGLYAASAKAPLAAARGLLEPSAPPVPSKPPPTTSWFEQLTRLTGRDVSRCPLCGGEIERHLLERPRPRGPPEQLVLL